MIEPATVHCPYCGEAFETVVDLSAGSAAYVEDCAICCRPIELHLHVPDDDPQAFRLDARADRD